MNDPGWIQGPVEEEPEGYAPTQLDGIDTMEQLPDYEEAAAVWEREQEYSIFDRY